MTDEDVVRMTAHENNVTVDELKFGDRTQRNVLIRMQCARRLRGRHLSFPEIGRMMGGMDHASIINLVRGGKGKKKR